MKKLFALAYFALILFFFVQLVLAISFTGITFTQLYSWGVGNICLVEPQTRGAVEYGGRTWIFFARQGTPVDVCYRSTVDGITFTSPLAIGVGTYVRVSVVVDSSGYIHYAWTNGSANLPLYYRRGLLNAGDGSITWNPLVEAVAAQAGLTYSRTNIELDSAGYPWIAYQIISGATYGGNVTRSSTKDGTWTTVSGFPKQICPLQASVMRTSLARLGSQKMLAFYSAVSETLRSRLWNGTAFEPEVTVSASIVGRGSFTEYSTVGLNDIVHIVFLSGAANPYYYKYVSYNVATKTFSATTTIFQNVEPMGVSLSYDSANNLLYVWSGIDNSGIARIVQLSLWQNGVWLFTNYTFYNTGNYDGVIGAVEYTDTSGIMSFQYTSGVGLSVVSATFVATPATASPSNSYRWISLSFPYVYGAITIWSIAMIIGVGAVFMKGSVQDLPYVILLGLGLLIVLFVSLAVLSSFAKI
jgi:hypothetical protein